VGSKLNEKPGSGFSGNQQPDYIVRAQVAKDECMKNAGTGFVNEQFCKDLSKKIENEGREAAKNR
jgi:hypothetical protein